MLKGIGGEKEMQGPSVLSQNSETLATFCCKVQGTLRAKGSGLLEPS